MTTNQIISIVVPITTTILGIIGSIIVSIINRNQEKNGKEKSSSSDESDSKKNIQKSGPTPKRYILVIFSGILGLLLGILITHPIEIIIKNYYQPNSINIKNVNINFIFTFPQEGQQLSANRPVICKGKYQLFPMNNNHPEIHIWLFTMDDYLDGYYIQGPVLLNNNGTWEGTVNSNANITKVVAVLVDDQANLIIKSWLTESKFGKQNSFPNGSRILTTIGVKI